MQIVAIEPFSSLADHERSFVDYDKLPVPLDDLARDYRVYTIENGGAITRLLAPASAALAPGSVIERSEDGTFTRCLSAISSHGGPAQVLFEIHDAAPLPVTAL